jgi:hypothetical protein
MNHDSTKNKTARENGSVKHGGFEKPGNATLSPEHDDGQRPYFVANHVTPNAFGENLWTGSGKLGFGRHEAAKKGLR